MLVLMILAAWVAASVALALLWVGYRRFVATHAVEDFDMPVEPAWTQPVSR